MNDLFLLLFLTLSIILVLKEGENVFKNLQSCSYHTVIHNPCAKGVSRATEALHATRLSSLHAGSFPR